VTFPTLDKARKEGTQMQSTDTREQAQPLAEADAMRQVAEALAPLGVDQRQRVLAWAELTHCARPPDRRRGSLPARITAARPELPDAFRVRDVVDLGIGKTGTVRSTMHRMADDGELCREGRGLFSFSRGQS
jgi:hypothetical protein